MVAYLLWWFLGVFGAHRFYLNKIGSGIFYLLTFGGFGIGWIIDLFTLSGQVDRFNSDNGFSQIQQAHQQSQNIVVNVTTPAAVGGSAVEVKISAEKQILALADQNDQLTLRQIVANTSLELDEAEETVKKLIARGMAKEQISADGKIKYDFN
ncbi:MAG: hypothetical protein A2087_05160 [Spirochaetes bacterium GWD1_61_31]|nr:MAG: hypothetical protein A2Y37_00905 [Spirochaetes bacterium GWB1_60_80]OHD36533.1 MAG: hypothetical protein A2087_05160 [Spirochaetes bacterium GWD1_61_31]OHD42247.1 MAG: hypothetical protein A2Y35_09355 [Spirochaetes bacterium GWE1_60_18]